MREQAVVVRGYDVSGMWVCPKCATLRGPAVHEYRDERLVQQCACERRLHRVDWPGWDISAVAELCRCCARVVIPSGSRWSGFFCDGCRPLVIALNRDAGRCVVPIGRHSMMNGFSLGGARPPTPENIERFVTGFSSVVDRIGHLERWTARRARLVLDRCTDREVVDLPTYVERAPVVLPGPATALEQLLSSR
jgi:hypothetical protein